MAKYRKRPVVIDAEQFDGRTLIDGMEWEIRTPSVNPDGGVQYRRVGVIRTLEGVMEVITGDWVITGVKGERYPCKPDIFAATYEAVAE